MAGLIADALAERERVLLLGTDAVGLPRGHLDAALAALDEHDLVLGAHEDGGFWCLGARAPGPPPGWLEGIDWEADATRAPVLARAAALGLSVAEAPCWFDVDHGADLHRVRARLEHAPDAAPASGAALAALDAGAAWLSVVVPALDEGERLDACLAALATQPGPLEIVVADGGSRDGSAERAAAAGHAVVVAPPGRGAQLAAGARLATGDALLFLHADGRLPRGGTDLVRAALARGREAGAFVIRTEPDPTLGNPFGPLLRLADFRSRVTRYPYGDQAMFVTRHAYEAVGGFRDLPIMEDYDLARRLARRAPLARLRPPVTVSGRRLQRQPLRTLLLLRLIPPLFRLGVSPALLARLYRP